MRMKQSEFCRRYCVAQNVVMKATRALPETNQKPWKPQPEYDETELAKACLDVLRKRAEYYQGELKKTITAMNDIKLMYKDRKERGKV